MFHWCPEETAAVIAAGSAAALSLVWVKARWFIFIAWLRAKLGLKDERHCCEENHKPSDSQRPSEADLRDRTKAFSSAAFGPVLSVRHIPFVPALHRLYIDALKANSVGLEPLFERTIHLPSIRICHCRRFGGQIHDERTDCIFTSRDEESK